MSVPPPAAALGSNSNYILTSQCNNITGLNVTINVTQNIVHQDSSGIWYSGSSDFSSTATPPPASSNAWQQSIFAVLSTPIGDPQINLGLAGYTASEDLASTWTTSASSSYPNLVLPAGLPAPDAAQKKRRQRLISLASPGSLPISVSFPLPTRPSLDTGPPAPNPNTPALTQQHISYIGIDEHIHERPHSPPPTTGSTTTSPCSLGNGIAPTASSAH